MSDVEILTYAVPTVVFCVSGLTAYFLGKDKSRFGLTVFGCIWAVFTASLFFGMWQAKGYDIYLYIMGLIGLSAPLFAGYVIGGGIGWSRKVKRNDA